MPAALHDRRAPRTNLLLPLLAAGLTLPACTPPAREADVPSTGLETLRPADPDAVDDTTATARADDETLDALVRDAVSALDQLYAGGLPDAPPATEPAPVVPDPEPTDPVLTAAADPEPEPETPPAPPPTLDERILNLAAELGVLVRERAETRADLAVALPTLAAIDALGADGLGPWLTADDGTLAPTERATAERLRDLHNRLTRDPEAAAAALTRVAEAIRTEQPVRIARTELCTRVEAFGRFTPIARTALLAGQPHRLIVYTEVESFDRVALDEAGTPMPATNADSPGSTPHTYRIEVSQELLLYHDADGLLAWRRPAEVSRYESRSPLRDFFLVDPIALPRTLTIGSYHLKVVVRDLADDSTDEVILPIQVVADANLARAR
jgi:hypothetical protein